MIDDNFKDESDENVIDSWFEQLIKEEEAAKKLEEDGFSYSEALSLIKKYGLSQLAEKS